MGYCGDFSEIYIKLPNFSFHGFGKRAALVLNDSKSEGWEKIGNVSLKSFSQISRILEEFRIQSCLEMEPQRQLTALGSDIYKGILLKHNFSLYHHLYIYQR